MYVGRKLCTFLGQYRSRYFNRVVNHNTLFFQNFSGGMFLDPPRFHVCQGPLLTFISPNTLWSARSITHVLGSLIIILRLLLFASKSIFSVYDQSTW